MSRTDEPDWSDGTGEPGAPGRRRAPVDLLVTGPLDVVELLRAGGADGPCEVVLGLVLAEAVPGAHVVCAAAVRVPAARGPAPEVDAGQLADLAAEMLVGAVVLADVDPGHAAPTRADVRRFVALRHRCARRGVALVDRVVVSSAGWWSLREAVLRDAA